MIDLQTQHPDFDLACELLAILPKFPTTALMSDLVDDLGLASQLQLRALIAQLTGDGYHIVTGRVGVLTGGNSVGKTPLDQPMDTGFWCALHAASWHAAQRDAASYLADMDRRASAAS